MVLPWTPPEWTVRRVEVFEAWEKNDIFTNPNPKQQIQSGGTAVYTVEQLRDVYAGIHRRPANHPELNGVELILNGDEGVIFRWLKSRSEVAGDHTTDGLVDVNPAEEEKVEDGTNVKKDAESEVKIRKEDKTG